MNAQFVRDNEGVIEMWIRPETTTERIAIESVAKEFGMEAESTSDFFRMRPINRFPHIDPNDPDAAELRKMAEFNSRVRSR